MYYFYSYEAIHNFYLNIFIIFLNTIKNIILTSFLKQIFKLNIVCLLLKLVLYYNYFIIRLL